MTLSPSVYFGALGFLVLAHLGLLYPYRTKWQKVLTDLGADIRSFNARNGYGQQVGQVELARGYTNPRHRENLGRFADANGVSVEAYEEGLDENVGKPIAPMGGFVFHVLATIYALSGLTYLIPGGFIPPEIFLLSSTVLFVLSLAVFLLS